MKDKVERLLPVVDYDRASDVLYISLGRPRSDEGIDYSDGIVFRYGIEDNKPSGVSVSGFQDFWWPQNKEKLALIISEHLPVAPQEIERAIAAAIS